MRVLVHALGVAALQYQDLFATPVEMYAYKLIAADQSWEDSRDACADLMAKPPGETAETPCAVDFLKAKRNIHIGGQNKMGFDRARCCIFWFILRCTDRSAIDNSCDRDGRQA